MNQQAAPIEKVFRFDKSVRLSYEQLKKLTGFEIHFKTLIPGEHEVDVRSAFIYNVHLVKVRGERGGFIFIDLFDKADKNVGSVKVFQYDEIELYDIAVPGFKVLFNVNTPNR